MSPIISNRGDELTFKVNFDNQTRFLFKLEEPDLNHCSIEFSNENDRICCSMSSSKLNSKFTSRPDHVQSKNEILLSYAVRPDCICITYWPTLVGFHTLNVTSSGKQISHRLLIEDQPQTSQTEPPANCVHPPPISYSSPSNAPFIEINLSELPERTMSVLSEFELLFDTAILKNRTNDPAENSSSLSAADELSSLRSLGKVSNELNKITNKYKISSCRTPSSLSSLSVASSAFNSSLTPEKGVLSPPAATPDALRAANPTANTPESRPILNNVNNVNNRMNSTALEPLQSSGDSSSCFYNGTLFEMHSNCISDSFVLAKFSPITQPAVIDLNNNRLFSSLNQPSGLSKKLLAFDDSHALVSDAIVGDENNNLPAVDNQRRIGDKNDLANQQSAQQAIRGRSIDRLASKPPTDQQVNLHDSVSSVDQPAHRIAAGRIGEREKKYKLPKSGESKENESATSGDQLVDNAAERAFSGTSLRRLSGEICQLNCQLNSHREVNASSSRPDSPEPANSRPTPPAPTTSSIRPNSSRTNDSASKASCEPSCSSESFRPVDPSLARSECCDLDRKFYEMFGDKSQPRSRSNSELACDSNDRIVFRKNGRSAQHYEKSSGRLNSQSRLSSQSGALNAKISSSNLNSKLDRKISKKKLSSLEPLLDKNIDPNRKSVENLFVKLYLNQVYGEELTDLEISKVINKKQTAATGSESSNGLVNGGEVTSANRTTDQPTANNAAVQAENVLPKEAYDRSKEKKNDRSESKRNDVKSALRPSSAVNLNRPLRGFGQNLNKNLSKISYQNLNNETMINSNGRITDQNANCAADVVDGCADKIQSRKKIFSQVNRFDQVKPTEFSGNQGKQFSGQLQRNRSKKKIGKRRVTPLYPDYHGQVSNQVDEIFIILKEEDKEVASSSAGPDRSTHLIYDSLSHLPVHRSTDSDPIGGLLFNLHNESAIDVSIESNPRLSGASANEVNDKSINELNSVGESAHNSSHSSSGTSTDKPNETEVVDKSILPVHQMVKHWTLTTNDINDSKMNNSRSRSTAVDIPNCSNIRNRRAIFERATSVLDGNKENEPKRNQISHNHSGSSLSALRAKQLTVRSDSNEQNGFSGWPGADCNYSHTKIGDHDQPSNSNQAKGLPQQSSQSMRVKTKLKQVNQLTNGGVGELPNQLSNGNVPPNKKNNELQRGQPVPTERLSTKGDCRPVNRAKSDRPKNSPLISGVHRALERCPASACSNVFSNDRSNVNEQFKVNVKSVKSFWESLSVK